MLKNVKLNSLVIGGMDVKLYESFIKNENLNGNINFIKNKILINYESENEQLLFLPIAYDKGYSAYNNGEVVKVENVFDGFIGLKVVEGDNNIVVTFVPVGFKLGLSISLISLLFGILFLYFKNKILSFEVINNFVYSVYIILVVIVTLVMYIIPILSFIGGIFSGRL